MAELSLALLKKQVRADDFCEDDYYLQHLLEAATDSVVTATNRTKEELVNEDGDLPKMLQQAVLMLAAHWYNQRESVAQVAMHEVPDSISALIKPYRRLV